MQYDPKQLDLLMKMVASTLGDRLPGLTKQQDNIMENRLDSILARHKGQADAITPEELEGAYEIAMLHVPVNDTKMGKEEKNPEKKKKTSMEFRNLIIEYANESGGKYKKELIKAGKLLGKGDPIALVRYLDSMDVSSREMFFKILKDNKESA